ncbi:LOW QUALITY PROTEIN: sulfotransferase 2A1-like [Phyllostomus hastatus]|uniref:LOW QUALITY PROTEIN: sulfotransferase 2A1-like n=1 Tax=Phyllostomus hastatus TaxID=9423 RepID=UPI001E67EA00|nr:LOW QUALITY PROTEIN: sulfotransferase 2A1-like [Phyllostomus hastatus]
MSDGYMWFEGVPFPVVGYTLEHLRAMQNFVFKDEDGLILSFPKSGTNWLIEILCLIHSKGDPTWIQSVPIWERSPWVETTSGYEVLKGREGPRLISSHLPIQLFPKSLFESKTKVIYLIRNPRCTLVSGYFFWSISNFVKKPESLKQYFEWFTQGDVAFGSWFDHVHGWMSMRGKENFLIVSYEELKQDTRNTIQKICQYLGRMLEPEEMNLVLKNSSFQVMKENKMSNYTLLPNWLLDGKNGSLMRRGTTGDWKKYFTVAQAEVFDKIFQEKMAGLPGELFPWERC